MMLTVLLLLVCVAVAKGNRIAQLVLECVGTTLHIIIAVCD
jgi:hypothetical protein